MNIGREILKIEGLTVKNKLHNIDFTLHEGEILGIAGLLGAGRTELARAVFGIDEIENGDGELGADDEDALDNQDLGHARHLPRFLECL